MRTVFITHSAAPAGSELSLLRTVRAWRSDVPPVVILGESGGLTEDFRASGATVLSVPLPTGLSAKRRSSAFASPFRTLGLVVTYARQLRAQLRPVEPKIVVARSLKAVVYGRLATWGTGVTFVWSVHDRLTVDYLGRAAWFYRHVVGRVCDAYIVNSESTLATIRPGSRPVLVLPPSVLLTEMPRPARDRFRVTVLGRLAPWKGQHLAIRAFAAELAGSDADLMIIGAPLFGENDYLESLRALSEELGVGNQVLFAGHVSNPVAELASTDILLHASTLPEPFGAVVLEGMQAGCVVVATEPGGPAEVIQAGRNGFLAQAGDLDSLRAALRTALDLDSDLRLALVAAAKITVRSYTAERLTSSLEKWLDELATGQARLIRRAVDPR